MFINFIAIDFPYESQCFLLLFPLYCVIVTLSHSHFLLFQVPQRHNVVVSVAAGTKWWTLIVRKSSVTTHTPQTAHNTMSVFSEVRFWSPAQEGLCTGTTFPFLVNISDFNLFSYRKTTCKFSKTFVLRMYVNYLRARWEHQIFTLFSSFKFDCLTHCTQSCFYL